MVLKVALITTSLDIGGTEKYIVEIADMLSKQSDVSIYCLNQPNKINLTREINPKVKLYIPTGSYRLNGILRLLRVKNLLNQNQEDIVIGFLHLGNLATLLARKSNHKSIITTIRRRDPHPLRNPILYVLLILSRIRSNIILTNCMKPTPKNIFFGRKIVFFPNLIKSMPALPIRDKSGPIKILTMANLRPEKGLEGICEATRYMLAENFPKFEWVICGEGVEREKLTHLISTEKLPITLAGQTFTSKLYYLDADIYVHPSLTEGFSNAILEAMAYGLPVIASDVGAASYCLQDNNLIYKPKDIPALVAKLEPLIRSKFIRAEIGKRNAQIVQTHFTWNIWAKTQMERILSSVDGK